MCKFLSINENLTADFLSTLNLPYVLGQIQYNRLAGIAYYTLKENCVLFKLNREFRNTLSKTYQQNRAQSESFLKSEDYLSDLLKCASFKYAFLKGAFLVKLYPLGLRTSNDFDILISGKDLTEIEAILRKAGFVQGDIRDDSIKLATREEIISSRMNRGETVPWIKQVDLPFQKFIEVDLNFSMDFKAKESKTLVENILDDADGRIITQNGDLKTLCNEDFLIHLCTHLFKEATVINWVKMGRDLSLYKFTDIYLFMKKFLDKSFAERFVTKVKTYGLQNECYYAIEKTKELFNMEIDIINDTLSNIKPKDISYLNQIFSPVDNKLYFYKYNFIDWVFTENRVDKLKEVKMYGKAEIDTK